MIPKFSEDPLKFVIFVKKNKDTFDSLLLSGRYNLTRDFNREYILEAYDFFIGFNLNDDANVASLYYDLDDFNDDCHETDINDIINEYINWINSTC